ncbi:MAG: hypothetical protein MUC97_16135, partial [Bernardetiaceae bacterium]|nr:hypothetical protein [Bernardetiaceae bacterium]
MLITGLMVVCWLVTYLAHSSALYLLAKILARSAWFADLRAKEMLWRFALVGSLVTATFQVGTGGGLFTQAWLPPLTITGTLEGLSGDDAAQLGGLAELSEEEVARLGIDPAAAPPADLPPFPAEVDMEVPQADSPGITAWAGRLALGWGLVAGGCLLFWYVNRWRFFYGLRARRRVADLDLLARTHLLAEAAGLGTVTLTVAEGLRSPVALGRREICLPPAALGLPADEQTAMLAHEMAHLRRGDPAWLTFYALLEKIFFFQPMQAAMRREWAEIAEQRCDAWAAQATGQPKALAECLVKVAEWVLAERQPAFAPGMALHKGSLRARILNLLRGRHLNERGQALWRLGVLGLGLLVGSALVLPGVTWFNNRGIMPWGGLGPSHLHFSLFGREWHMSYAPAPPDAVEVPVPVEAPEWPEAWAEVGLADEPLADTSRFGTDFMLVVHRQGGHQIFKAGVLIAPAHYPQYRADFEVTDRQIVLKAGTTRPVVVSLGQPLNLVQKQVELQAQLAELQAERAEKMAELEAGLAEKEAELHQRLFELQDRQGQ